jgi:hypothetical protein
MAKKLTHDELRRSYEAANTADKEIFAEQRTNVLLVAGEHYAKKNSKFLERVRDEKNLSQEQKLRLTKNHIYKIMRLYANSITSFCPDVIPTPTDDKNLQDIKSADLHNKVMKYAKNKYRMKEKKRDWADDFTIIGEVGTKTFWDPSKGKQIGWEQAQDELGQPMFDTDEVTGEQTPTQGEGAIYSGDFVFEKFYGFNFLLAAGFTSYEDSPEVHIRKMVSTDLLKAQYAKDPEKLKLFNSTKDETMVVFDATKGAYGMAENQTMVVETFVRPSIACPKGYYYYWTEDGVFEEDELPFGVWPIAYAPFDKYQTSRRGRSHIKVLRPFQAELNRSASKMAEHQITIGDDKIITQAGSEVTQGNTLPGVRGYVVSGAPPTILPGRDGSQYAAYCAAQVEEMYKASLVAEANEEAPAQVDPFSLIFRAASQKVKFTPYSERFEQFLADVWLIFLQLARQYLPDEELLEAIGKSEQANIEEFRNPSAIGYQIKMEPQAEDMETKLGRQLTMTNTLQYVGNKLEREDIGRILANMPYGNLGESMKDLTRNYDMSVNLMLALDRGQNPQMSPGMPHDYLVKRLESRTLEGDFEFLPPNIKQLYQMRIQEHAQAQSQQLAQLKAMEADFIPTGGAMITCEMYVPAPTATDPNKSVRVKLPYESLQWTIDRLSKQGSTLGALEDMSMKNQLQIGQAAGIPGPQGPVGRMDPQPDRPSMFARGPASQAPVPS